MPASLLTSQFEILEPLAPDERGVVVEVDRSVDDVVGGLPGLRERVDVAARGTRSRSRSAPNVATLSISRVILSDKLGVVAATAVERVHVVDRRPREQLLDQRVDRVARPASPARPRRSGGTRTSPGSRSATGVWSTSQRCSHSSRPSSSGRRSIATLARASRRSPSADSGGSRSGAAPRPPAGHPSCRPSPSASAIRGQVRVRPDAHDRADRLVEGRRAAARRRPASSSMFTCSRRTPALARRAWRSGPAQGRGQVAHPRQRTSASSRGDRTRRLHRPQRRVGDERPQPAGPGVRAVGGRGKRRRTQPELRRSPMYDADDDCERITVEPPLDRAEAAVVGGLAGVGCGPRRVWAGQPSRRSPWLPCHDGCCLVPESRPHLGSAADPVAWLRLLIREVLAPRAAEARARADRLGLPGGHRSGAGCCSTSTGPAEAGRRQQQPGPGDAARRRSVPRGAGAPASTGRGGAAGEDEGARAKREGQRADW